MGFNDFWEYRCGNCVITQNSHRHRTSTEVTIHCHYYYCTHKVVHFYISGSIIQQLVAVLLKPIPLWHKIYQIGFSISEVLVSVQPIVSGIWHRLCYIPTSVSRHDTFARSDLHQHNVRATFERIAGSRMKVCYYRLPTPTGFLEGDRVWLYHSTWTKQKFTNLQLS